MTENAATLLCSMPAAVSSSAWRQAREAPCTSLPCFRHAPTSGLSMALLPAPAAPIATLNRPPLPSRSIAARCVLPCASATCNSDRSIC